MKNIIEDEDFFLNDNNNADTKIIDGIFLRTPNTIKMQNFDINIDNLSRNKPGKLMEKVYDIEKLENIKINIKNRKYKFSAKIFISILAIFLFSIVPIKIIDTATNLKAQAKNTIADLETIYPLIESGNYEQTKEKLLIIQKNIEVLQRSLSDLGQKNMLLGDISHFQDSISSNSNLLDIVYSISKLANVLIDDLQFLSNLSLSNINSEVGAKEIFSNSKKLYVDLKNIEPEIKLLKYKIDMLDVTKFDQKDRIYIQALKNNSQKMLDYFSAGLIASKNTGSFLGENYDRKYLVLFQNDTELRPTGGFIGTYGIITIRNAQIKNVFIDSIYNADGQQTKYIDAPPPLAKMAPRHYMRNANWDPDFPTSAQYIINMYETENGFTPDGVVAIDTKPFLDLLAVTGPINLVKYNTNIDKDNFLATTQYKTSVDYNPDDKNPKKFLAEFAPLFLEKIFSIDNLNKNQVSKILLNNIRERHIQFFSPNADMQRFFTLLELSGSIKKNNGDYFLYINANIGGQKTNGLIEEKLDHEIIQSSDNRITHRVTLKRKHTGTYNWPSGINYSYIRFYIPKGSHVIDIQGFEKDESIKRDSASGAIYMEERPGEYAGKAQVSDLAISEEHDKMVIGTWQTIKPGEEIVSEITYELPDSIRFNNFSTDYNLFIQKQGGISKQSTTVELKHEQKAIYSKNFDLVKDTFINQNSK